jgi:hypothetical protein
MYCLCVNVYCHRVTTQLQLINISYHKRLPKYILLYTGLFREMSHWHGRDIDRYVVTARSELHPQFQCVPLLPKIFLLPLQLPSVTAKSCSVQDQIFGSIPSWRASDSTLQLAYPTKRATTSFGSCSSTSKINDVASTLPRSISLRQEFQRITGGGDGEGVAYVNRWIGRGCWQACPPFWAD